MSSIADNNLTNFGDDMSGILKLAEMLPQTSLTSLKCAASRLLIARRHCPCSLLCHGPSTQWTQLCLLCGSVDGYALPIDELKGTKPVESIDFSNKGLEVTSAIIIAACIKENAVLKELKCATRFFHA